MPVVLLRIDDRLVHGQVSVGWSRHLRADRIVVVSDECAADPAAVALMEMGAPEGISFECLGVADAARRWAEIEAAKPRTIVLVASPEVLLGLAEAGATPGEVNLGGLHPAAGGRRIADGVSATEADLAALRALLDRGVRVFVQSAPSGRPTALDSLLAAAAP